MQTIAMAEFRTSSAGGLILHSFHSSELLADPAAEGSRIGQMKIAINEMLAALKIKTGRVNYAIPAQSVFTRFVKLPSVEADQVDQMIQFEAQQNVPFPIDEVVWDYQLVGGQDADRLEVVLVAIKADMLDELNGAVEEAGLTTGVVDVAPMALYNAFRYNYSDLGGCSLLIDIGARTTNLIFVEPNKVFSRSIPIGGTTITAAIAKDFNEPFASAEERKRTMGFVSLGGAYAEPSDPDQARVSKMIRNTMTRLHAEIARSISFYRSQQAGAQPTRVFLCGGSMALAYMREFFSEKLQLPIEFLNPLRNVTVASGVDAEHVGRSAHILGELVGLSLRSISDCPMELNLQPASVEKAQQLAAKRPYLILAGLCVVLSVVGWWLYFQKTTAVETAVTAELDQKIAPLKRVEDQFTAVRNDIKNVQATAAPFVQAVQDRDYWVRVLDEINARIPQQYIWITYFEPMRFEDGKPVASLTPSTFTITPSPGAGSNAPAPPPPAAPITEGNAPGGKPGAAKSGFGVRLKGLYLENTQEAAVVDQFVKSLQDSPYVASVTVVTRGTPDQNLWAYDYELGVELKQAISQE
jgi:type IV pilus assembly protein PilM